MENIEETEDYGYGYAQSKLEQGKEQSLGGLALLNKKLHNCSDDFKKIKEKLDNATITMGVSTATGLATTLPFLFSENQTGDLSDPTHRALLATAVASFTVASISSRLWKKYQSEYNKAYAEKEEVTSAVEEQEDVVKSYEIAQDRNDFINALNEEGYNIQGHFTTEPISSFSEQFKMQESQIQASQFQITPDSLMQPTIPQFETEDFCQ